MDLRDGMNSDGKYRWGMERTRNLLRNPGSQLHKFLLVQFGLKVSHELLEDDYAAWL